MTATASEIRLMASPSMSTVLGELGPRFERAAGHIVTVQYGLVPAQKQRIDSGDFDIAVVPSFVLDDAIKQGKIAADTRAPLARAILAVGVRASAPKPEVSSIDAFKRALLNAKSVSYAADEPTGMSITKEFEGLGIAEAMKAKTKSKDAVADVWQAVANGEAELGFGFASIALAAPGVEIAGFFPPELQFSTVMAAGVGTSSSQADPARALIRYLLSPEAAAVIRAKGLEPVSP